MCIGAKKAICIYHICLKLFLFLRPTNEHCAVFKWMRLSKRIMWKTSLNLLWTLFMAFCFLTGPNTNTEVKLVHTELVVLFLFIFFSSSSHSSKKIVYRKRSTTCHDGYEYMWICVCAVGTFIFHITSTKNILVLLFWKLNEWCVCAWAWVWELVFSVFLLRFALIY